VRDRIENILQKCETVARELKSGIVLGKCRQLSKIESGEIVALRKGFVYGGETFEDFICSYRNVAGIVRKFKGLFNNAQNYECHRKELSFLRGLENDNERDGKLCTFFTLLGTGSLVQNPWNDAITRGSEKFVFFQSSISFVLFLALDSY
jgi:hypothetical protein